MRLRMLNRTSLLLLGATIFLVGATAVAVPGSHSAQAQEGFTTASIQGTYAFTRTIGANLVVRVGLLNASDNGSGTGSYMSNEPSPAGGRQVLAITYAVTYIINANGTGTTAITHTLPDGSTVKGTLDFVITQARQAGSLRLAEEFLAIPREPFAGTGMVGTLIFKRLPDGAVFTDASLQGSYAFLSTTPAEILSLGVCVHDESGNTKLSGINNAPGPACGLPGTQRCIMPLAAVGKIAANANGTGVLSVTVPNGSTWTYDFVTTQATRLGPFTLATEMFCVARELLPGGS